MSLVHHRHLHPRRAAFSLLRAGVMDRMAIALAALAMLWLCVGWALDWF